MQIHHESEKQQMDEIMILKFATQYIHGTVQLTCFDVTCKIFLTVSIVNISYDWLLIRIASWIISNHS